MEGNSLSSEDVTEQKAGEETNNSEDGGDILQNDPFSLHFDQEIAGDVVSCICQKDKLLDEISWPQLGNLVLSNYKAVSHSLEKICSLDSSHLVPILKRNIEKALHLCKLSSCLSDQQLEIFDILSQYKDFLHNERTLTNGEEIRFVYCLHALNHIMKTRSRVLHHNSKLGKQSDNEYRDQGFTRPKVLIIAPYKESALRIVNIFINLLVPDTKGNVVNKKRFQEDYGCHEPPAKKLKPKPADHDAMFAGNIEDSFRIGLSVTKRSLRLFADFYAADIIVASPLGLRTIIGDKGEKDRNFDFLSSIEVLIVDQADVYLMQNWEHVLHVMQHLNLQSKEQHGVDFSRIRMWTLNGHAKYYRQSAVFGCVSTPVVTSLFNKFSENYAGRVILRNPVLTGAIQEVIVQVPQVFHRFEASKINEMPEERFQFFVKKVLPSFKDAIMQHTLIFIPSYFDYVRIRNHFKRNEMSFVQICEYTKDGKVARARDMFFHKQKHFLLYTERAHFFKRHRIKGVHHVIFYDLPVYPHFYSEVCNFLHPDFWGKKKDESTNTSCTVLYSVYDAQQLVAIVGFERTRLMLNSEKKVHMFATGKS